MLFQTHLSEIMNSQLQLLNYAVSVHVLFFKTEISFLQSKLNICLFITVWIVILDVDGKKKKQQQQQTSTDASFVIWGSEIFAKVASNVVREKEKIDICEGNH